MPSEIQWTWSAPHNDYYYVTYDAYGEFCHVSAFPANPTVTLIHIGQIQYHFYKVVTGTRARQDSGPSEDVQSTASPPDPGMALNARMIVRSVNKLQHSSQRHQESTFKFYSWDPRGWMDRASRLQYVLLYQESFATCLTDYSVHNANRLGRCSIFPRRKSVCDASFGACRWPICL